MDKKYDIFISHKNEQLSWALRLQSTFELYGYRVFVDHSTRHGLSAKQNWDEQLRIQCTNAKHMIVLWSELVSSNPQSFVHKEIKWRLESPAHEVILLPLNEMQQAPLFGDIEDYYGKRQAFRDFIKLYEQLSSDEADAGAEQVDEFRWHKATRRFLEQEIPDAEKELIEVPFIVAAMTRKQAEEIERREKLRVREDVFDRLMSIIGHARPFDTTSYGETPEDWKPLPAMQQYRWKSPSIREILTHYEQERRRYIRQNLRLLGHTAEYRLSRVCTPFTSQIAGTSNQRSAALMYLQKRPCLILVDPLSLMHKDVYRIYDTVKTKIENVFTIGVSPFIPILHSDFSEYLTQEADLIEALGLFGSYESFHSFFDDALKASVMNVDHGYELTRWIQFATDNITRFLLNPQPDPLWSENTNVRSGPSRPPVF